MSINNVPPRYILCDSIKKGWYMLTTFLDTKNDMRKSLNNSSHDFDSIVKTDINKTEAKATTYTSLLTQAIPAKIKFKNYVQINYLFFLRFFI